MTDSFTNRQPAGGFLFLVQYKRKRLPEILFRERRRRWGKVTVH
ncbi:hypothetical protein HMPREF0201_02261 [Cedecea davisae DSM 4568]|uniref:Uncharacterized protein n=1 Tax=Cedecea davisae DSM 4568 TaxID=566551 RepID=S3IWW2_9ENTR|nr:hypothetical protein HMPREF0201_02261 [Cedecea davisae DSM 4568]